MFLFKLALWQQGLIVLVIAIILSTFIVSVLKSAPLSLLQQLMYLAAVALMLPNAFWALTIVQGYYPRLDGGLVAVIFLGSIAGQLTFGYLSEPLIRWTVSRL